VSGPDAVLSRTVRGEEARGDDWAIEVSGLRKSYGDVEAVRGVGFRVAHGEVFCLLGPNGAGKTTTVEILEGYRTRSGGQARVLGMDPARGPRELRERVGIVLQQCGVQSYLSVFELVEMYGRYYSSSRPVDEVIEVVGLQSKHDTRANDLSGGQRRRLDLALALVGDPDLIFLDEPTTGFDPAARRNAWSTIESLRDLGKTIFLTTHFMDEAEALADRIMILAAGQIVASGTPQTIGGRSAGATVISFSLPEGVTHGDVPSLPGQLEAPAVTAHAAHGRVEIEVSEPIPALHALSGWATDRRLALPDITVNRPSLEDIYLKLTASSH
jgi:ABC-2 type transport system ATP-binding protein